MIRNLVARAAALAGLLALAVLLTDGARPVPQATAPVAWSHSPTATATATAAATAAAATTTAAPVAWSRSDEGRTTFGVQPSGPRKPDRRPNLSYGVTPGATVTDHVAVLNYGRKPLTLRLYAGDGFTTPDGGFDLLAAKHKAKDAGSWVKLRRGRLTLAPGARAIVPFRLTVPRHATPGDHAGGIVASVSAMRTTAGGDRVAVEQRVGARLYIRVAGELTSVLDVHRVSASYEASAFGSGTATVTYSVRNTGNVRLGATQAVRVSDWFQAQRATGHREELPELLPGASLTFTAQASGVLPTFRDTATVVVTPKPVKGDVPRGALTPVTDEKGFAAVSWVYLGLLVLPLGALALWLVRRLRRRRALARPAVVFATCLAALLAVPLLPAPAARAADGSLTITPRRGTDRSLISLTPSAPCPDGTTYVIAWMRGKGFPAEGQIVVTLSELAIYPPGDSGGPVLPLGAMPRDFASMARVAKFTGTYTITVRCLKDPFQQKALREFTGSLTFTSPTVYGGGTRARVERAPASAPGSAAPSAPPAEDPSAAPASAAPAPPAKDPAAAPAAAVAGEDGGGGVPVPALSLTLAAVLALAGGAWWWRTRPAAPAAEGRVEWDD
ncbi:WxL protein peptidoglycan domain-containing protein [Streptomyces polyrhachis]|uniref:WxL protein peptidoglycan domain-containing protein n=1 Tax=Streptomyces polyrhachis TaxID=1282885 RepID=A0ABW2GIU5_9ACTN